MPKSKRADDALVINDENDRILELWFFAQASAELSEKYGSSDFLFIANMNGQEEQKTLESCQDYAEHVPDTLEVCFLRRKVTLSLPVVEQLVNESVTVALYSRLPDALPERRATIVSKPAKTGGKPRRSKKGGEIPPLEEMRQLFSLTFDLADLLTASSMRRFVEVSPDAVLHGCAVEARCGTPFLPPVKLNRCRPLKIEFRSISNLPKIATGKDPLFLYFKFGDVEFKSPMLCVSADGKLVYRRVVFLGSGTPLSAYQDIFFKKMEISVFSGPKTCVGTGMVSLRAAATDQQTLFHEAAHLLPTRSIPSLEDNCLTRGTIVSLRVDLFTPLPHPRHVLSDGQPACGHFLTRGIIRMPYAAKWTVSVLEVLISTLLGFKKPHPNEDVYQRVVPSPAQDLTSVKEKKKDRSRHHKGHMMPPSRPPSLPSLFDSPFDIVTPPGISGFEVMDDNLRIICVEGQAVEVHKILQRVSAVAAHNPELKIFMNAELFVPKRAYLVFPPLVTFPKASNTGSTPSMTAIATDAGKIETSADDSVANKSVFLERSTTSGRSGLPSTVCHPAGSAVTAVKGIGVGGGSGATVFSGKEPDENTEEELNGAEAGGTGGRIHRIRVKESIESLMSHQRYLLKKALSSDCVSCYTKLHAMCGCHSLLEVVERDLFPTPEELIALERSFGRTLGLCDIFGTQEFINIELAKGEDNDTLSPVAETVCPVDINVGRLQWCDIGRVVFFEAIKVTSRRRKIPLCVRARYPWVCWMRTLDGKKDVLCAFPMNSQPANTIRYLVEAQVVRCGEILCLYALKCNSLAKSCTNSRNPAYEAHLVASGRRRVYPFPCTRQEGCVPSPQMNLARRRNPSLDSSDSEESRSSIDSPPRETVMSTNLLTIKPERNFLEENRRKNAFPKKEVSRRTAADYDLCWKLYRQRAPGVSQELPRGPPMHF